MGGIDVADAQVGFIYEGTLAGRVLGIRPIVCRGTISRAGTMLWQLILRIRICLKSYVYSSVGRPAVGLWLWTGEGGNLGKVFEQCATLRHDNSKLPATRGEFLVSSQACHEHRRLSSADKGTTLGM